MYNKVTKVGTTALRDILMPEAERRAGVCRDVLPYKGRNVLLASSATIQRRAAKRQTENHVAIPAARIRQVADESAPLADFILDILCEDLDANCRALAVALGLWSEPWPEGESAPRFEIEVDCAVYWNLTAGGSGLERWDSSDVPGLDAFTDQSQAMDALRCIWRAIEGSDR